MGSERIQGIKMYNSKDGRKMGTYLKNKQLTLEITNRCTAKCVMCPREKLTYKRGVMSNALFRKIADDASDCGVTLLDLCGFGDAFLDKDLFTKLRYVRENHPSMKIYTSSTCIAMSPNTYRDVAECIDILKISFYGMTPEVYKKVHGGIDYATAISNILGFLDYNNKKNSVHTIMRLTVVDENRHQMDDWIKYWSPKIDEIMVWEPHNFADGRNYRDISGEKQRSCNRPIYGGLNVAWDGKVHPCCFDYNHVMIVGDLNIQTISEILNGKPFLNIQKKHMENDFKGLLCETCEQTAPDDSALLYDSNQKRKVGMLTASDFNLYTGDGGND